MFQDRTTENGVKTAVHNFQKAAGTFRYLHNHFSNPPSMDMQPQTLTMLIQLMMVSSTMGNNSDWKKT